MALVISTLMSVGTAAYAVSEQDKAADEYERQLDDEEAALEEAKNAEDALSLLEGQEEEEEQKKALARRARTFLTGYQGTISQPRGGTSLGG